VTTSTATPIQRLMEHAFPEPNCGCWFFMGPLDKGGYGRLNVGDLKALAHRVSYELFKGAIPDGLEIRHSCDIRCCVNPDHLSVGTRKDNMADMDAHGRRVPSPGSRHGLSKLTEEDIPVIRARRAAGEIYRTIAADFGVTLQNVMYICVRATWTHVP
jgi:hypothetical protein